ncbi:MAG: hypothetical protein VKJ04_05190 [Vampirovibrionales bacterium]|nr:hypothetical protein [Vampirovibrionales bacterium]
MGDWDRETIQWRQGSCLSHEHIVRLGLIKPEDTESVAVVISHDCDLLQAPTVENSVEFIISKKIAKQDGNFSFGKNARRLHLNFQSETEEVYLDLKAVDKQSIDKVTIFAEQPSNQLTLDNPAKAILQKWLAARYRRSAFPDNFNNIIKDNKIENFLKKIIEPLGDILIAVMVQIEETTDEKVPFKLTLYLLHSTRNNSEAVISRLQSAVTAIKDLFEKHFTDESAEWQQLELIDCVDVSEEVLTYAQTLMLKKWEFDHLSLQTNPQQEIFQET